MATAVEDIRARLETTESNLQNAADDTVQNPKFQAGSLTLVAGQSAITPATLTATSVIMVGVNTPNTDAASRKYAALSTTRVNGAPGSFRAQALSAVGGGDINAADVSAVDYVIVDL